MRDILQITGCILAGIIAIVVDVTAILKFKSSNKDKLAEAWLFEGLLRGSAFAIVVLVIIVLISLLF